MAGGSLGAVVNKKALAETPKEALNWYMWFVCWTVCTSGGLHGYNSSNISGILKMHNFVQSYHLDTYTSTELTNVTGWVTSVIVLGGVVGALVSSPINDKFGRKVSLWISGLIYLVGCIVQISTNSNINQAIGGRAIQGFGGGIGTVTGTMFVSELAPKAVRGLMGALFSTNTLLGIALGYWANYGALLNISDDSPWQWRTPLIVQMIPGIFMVIGVPFVIESPRWLAQHDKVERAHQQLSKLRHLPEDHPFVIQEMTDITGAIELERNKSISWFGLMHELKADRTLARRFILVLVVQVGFNFSGGNSITYYETAILDTIGIDGNGAYLFASIYGMVKLVSSLVYAFLCAERFGRRKMLLFSGFVDVAAVTWISIYLGALDGNKKGGYAAVAALMVFAFGYGTGWSPVAFGLNGELFPLQFRAKIMSITLTLQYLINFILVKEFGNIAASGGACAPFAMFAGVSTVILVYLFFALPEPKGIALEHTHLLFNNHWFANGLKSRQSHHMIRNEERINQKSFQDPAKNQVEVRHIEETEAKEA